MNKYLSASLNNVSLDWENSWAAKSLQEAYDARFQQRQMQEREEKLLKLYENQQQRAFEKVSRGSAGSNTSSTSGGSTGGGKVRQMFDERRQKAGIDKSYPLEPIKTRTNNRVSSMERKSNPMPITTSRTVVKSTVQKNMSSIKNGKTVASKRQVVQSIYNNNDGDESYEERKYEDANTDLFNSDSHRNLIDMMNNHNLNDNLDNEVLPAIGFDEVDKPYIPEKISNGNGIVRSKNVAVKKVIETKPVAKTNGVVPSTRKASNPSPKKPARVSPPARTVSSPGRNVSSPAQSSRVSTSMSPVKGPAKPATAPLNTRPSVKQNVKSAVVRDDLAECSYCGRRFTADRLQKHEDVCSKTGKKKRKVYDATKHRVAGTELETYVLRGPKGRSALSSKSASKQTNQEDWRRTHEEFIAAIRTAKQI